MNECLMTPQHKNTLATGCQMIFIALIIPYKKEYGKWYYIQLNGQIVYECVRCVYMVCKCVCVCMLVYVCMSMCVHACVNSGYLVRKSKGLV